MATARTPRGAWIDAGLRALGAGGPDAVRIEALARDLGVTKGGFYGYFNDRTALLEEMLDVWESRSVGEAIDRAENAGGDPLDRARLAAELTFSRDLLPVDLALREWARRDPAIAARLARVDDRRMDYLRSHFRAAYPDPIDLEARCLLAFCAAIASDLTRAHHEGYSRDEVVAHASALLFGGAGATSVARPDPAD